MRAPHGCGEGEGAGRVYHPMEQIEVTVPAEVAAEETPRGEWIPGWRSSSHEQVSTLRAGSARAPRGLRSVQRAASVRVLYGPWYERP